MTSIEIISFLAQDTTQGPAGPSIANLLMPFMLIIVLYIFVIQRPQQKERQNRLNQLKAMKKGDKVVSIGGICGKVESIDKEAKRVTIVTGKGTTLTFLESAIDRVEAKEKGAS